MQTFAFDGRILMLGYGGVARCTLPLLLRHLKMPRERITVLDMEPLEGLVPQGVPFVRCQITPENYRDELARLLGPGDMLIDLAWNIDCCDLLDFCRQHGVRYINTSVELWDPYTGADLLPPTERTLYVRHMAIRRLIAQWGDNAGPTAILEHGANPGLVSHFTRRALRDIGERLLREPCDRGLRVDVERHLADRAWARLAQTLGVRVIHISEIDTQQIDRPRRTDQFLNTWSVEGFFEEAISPAEMGWGTHERLLPADAHVHAAGPCNQICLDRWGMNTFVRSRVPSCEITGMVIRHGEAFSISEALTVRNSAGTAEYRPTVHYAYRPCDVACESLEELRRRKHVLQEDWKILADEIVDGWDELGVLLMGHPYRSWWAGTILDIHQARQLVPHQNATTLQVAASVLGAVVYMLRHPHEGVRLPDDLPHEEILSVADPYLGRVVSEPLDWSPIAGLTEGDDAWQFANFLVSPPARRKTGASRRALRAHPAPAHPVAARRHPDLPTEPHSAATE